MTVRRMGYGAMQLAGPACGDRRAIRMRQWPCCAKQLPLA